MCGNVARALAPRPGLFQVKLESQDQMTGDFYTNRTTAVEQQSFAARTHAHTHTNNYLELVWFRVEVTCPEHSGFLTLGVAQLHCDSVADSFHKLEKKGSRTHNQGICFLLTRTNCILYSHLIQALLVCYTVVIPFLATPKQNNPSTLCGCFWMLPLQHGLYWLIENAGGWGAEKNNNAQACVKIGWWSCRARVPLPAETTA